MPEGMPPALVGALWRMGAVSDDDLAATLLDLAVSGVLTIAPGESTPATAAGAQPKRAPAKPASAFVISLDQTKLDEVDDLTRPLVRLLDTVIGKDSMTMEQLEAVGDGARGALPRRCRRVA